MYLQLEGNSFLNMSCKFPSRTSKPVNPYMHCYYRIRQSRYFDIGGAVGEVNPMGPMVISITFSGALI